LAIKLTLEEIYRFKNDSIQSKTWGLTVTDKYTKALLTVIALSLVTIALKDLKVINNASAIGNEPIKVILCDLDNDCVDIRYKGKLRINTSK
jgi:hypothetical protein